MQRACLCKSFMTFSHAEDVVACPLPLGVSWQSLKTEFDEEDDSASAANGSTASISGKSADAPQRAEATRTFPTGAHRLAFTSAPDTTLTKL